VIVDGLVWIALFVAASTVADQINIAMTECARAILDSLEGSATFELVPTTATGTDIALTDRVTVDKAGQAQIARPMCVPTNVLTTASVSTECVCAILRTRGSIARCSAVLTSVQIVDIATTALAIARRVRLALIVAWLPA